MTRTLPVLVMTLFIAPHAAFAQDFSPAGSFRTDTGTATGQKQIAGWVENVRLEDSTLLVKAKLDSGAATSSLDVRYTRLFKLNRQRMVRFEIEDPETEQRVTFERPVVRMVRIKQHGGGYLRRPVVLMRVCLGTNAHEVEMSLADRSNFVYSMLLGRSALQNIAIIDPAETYLISPECEDEEIYD